MSRVEKYRNPRVLQKK